MDYAQAKTILPNSTRNGIITLIFKKGDKDRITNYRPISLLNIDYKIISSTLAYKLKKVIPSLINSVQRGFIPGRDIRSNIIEAKMIIAATTRNNMSGAITFWDWEKAFDRLDRQWLFKIMAKQNIGNTFLNAVKTLMNCSTGHVLVNGSMTPQFNIYSGVRQGCAISPFLFSN